MERISKEGDGRADCEVTDHWSLSCWSLITDNHLQSPDSANLHQHLPIQKGSQKPLRIWILSWNISKNIERGAHLTESWILVCMMMVIVACVNLWMKMWWRSATGSLGQLWLPSLGVKSIENGTKEEEEAELPWQISYLRLTKRKRRVILGGRQTLLCRFCP